MTSFRTLVLAVLAVLLVSAAPASAARNQETSFEAPRDLLNPDTRAGALDEIQGLGVKSLRVVMLWKRVAPSSDSSTKPDFDTTDPAGYAWGEYDGLLTDAKARGMKVLLTVSGPVPRWATEDKKDSLTRPDPAEFAQFMTAVGRHMASRVTTWSVWNEPNQPQFLLPQFDSRKRPVSPRIYRALYKAALKGLKAAKVANPEVLFGETSPIGTGKVVAPLTFLRGALCLDSKNRLQKGCSKLPMAGIAHHAYTPRSGPRYVPPSPNAVTIGVLGRLTTLMDRAAKVGATPAKLPLHLTEFGIQSLPDRVVGVSLQQQNEFRALSERIAYDNPRVKTFSQYLLRDDESGSGASKYSGFESGLRTTGGKAKPALDGFRLVLSAKATSAGTTLWGLVRPAGGAVSARLQYRSGSSGRWTALTTVRTNSLGFFTLRTKTVKSRQYRVLWTNPAGTELAGPGTRALL